MEKKTSTFETLADSGQNVGATRQTGLRAPRLRSPRRRGNPAPPPPAPRLRGAPSLRRLKSHRDEWLDDNEVAMLSTRTIKLRRETTDRLLQWLESQNETECGTPQLRRYFATQVNLNTGEPLAVDTLDSYRRTLTAWWNWMQRNDLVSQNAMDGIPPIPKSKKKMNQQVQPFSEEQWRSLITAAAKSPFPRRDSALVHLLLDTGMRAGEVCAVQMKHIEMSARSIRIIGKGGKERTVFYGPLTSRFLWAYLRERGVEPEEMPNIYLFVACSGGNAGAPMRPRGIYGIIQKICKRCGIRDGKMGPHRLRHTFATEMVKNQAYQDVVQQLLGHSSPQMTARYVSLAANDLRMQHARSSPLSGAETGKTKVKKR